MAGKRIQWTDFEQDTLYAGTVDILKNKPKMKLLEAFNMAQVALPENRRRKHVRGPSQLTRELRERFILNGYLQKDWLGKKKVEAQEQKPDPKDIRIHELEQELTEVKATLEIVSRRKDDLLEENRQLREQPGPMEVIQKWVAGTLAMALKEASHIPNLSFQPINPLPIERTPIPDFERERRKNPMPTSSTGDMRPRIAVVAEFNSDAEMTGIHEQVKDIAQMRYLNSLTKLDSLSGFASNGGKVIVWNDRLPHGWKQKIVSQGVLFQYCNGTPNNVIEFIRQVAGKKSHA